MIERSSLDAAIEFALDALRKKNTFVGKKDLSRRQIKNALKVIAPGESDLTAMYDTTRLKSGKSGFVIASGKLYLEDVIIPCIDLTQLEALHVAPSNDHLLFKLSGKEKEVRVYAGIYRLPLAIFLYTMMEAPSLDDNPDMRPFSIMLSRSRDIYCANLRNYCIMQPGFKTREEMTRKDKTALTDTFPALDPENVIAYRLYEPPHNDLMVFTHNAYYYRYGDIIDRQPLPDISFVTYTESLDSGPLKLECDTGGPWYYTYASTSKHAVEQIFNGISLFFRKNTFSPVSGTTDLTEETARNMRRNYEAMISIENGGNPYKVKNTDALVQLAREKEARKEFDDLPGMFYCIAYRTPQNLAAYYYLKSLFYSPVTIDSLFKMDYYRSSMLSFAKDDHYLAESDYRIALSSPDGSADPLFCKWRIKAVEFYMLILVIAHHNPATDKPLEKDIYDILNEIVDLINSKASRFGDKHIPRVERPRNARS